MGLTNVCCLIRTAPTTQGGTVESLLDIGRQLVPKNIIMAAATSQVSSFAEPKHGILTSYHIHNSHGSEAYG